MNYLIGRKGRKPTRKKMFILHSVLKKKNIGKSLILSVMHVSDPILSLALEVCYVPIGSAE